MRFSFRSYWYRRVWSERIKKKQKSEGKAMRPIRSVSDYVLELDPEDPGISSELALHGTHEPVSTRFLESILQPKMTVIDVGANIGYYALLESKRVGQGGCVIAIEPEHRNFQLLQRNVRLNDAQNLKILNLAVSDYVGHGALNIGHVSNVHSLEGSESSIGTQEVEVASIDTLTDHMLSVDLIRMDIEGHECVVINCMEKTLSKFKPRLMIEIHPQEVGAQKTITLLKKLDKLGYETIAVIPRSADFATTKNFNAVEHLGLLELANDPRVNIKPEGFMVFMKSIDKVE